MQTYIHRAGLQVAKPLSDFIEAEVLPSLAITADDYWQGFADLIERFSPINRALLDTRDTLQQQIDTWCKANKGQFDAESYRAFLKEIGYLLPECADFDIDVANVDAEISEQPGPQLVVPTSNARFALNATNARWGSLYDALYGSDVIGQSEGREAGSGYNPLRGAAVIAFAKDFLDENFPLEQGSHHQVTAYSVQSGQLMVELSDGSSSTLKASQFRGFQGAEASPSAILLRNNNLHVILDVDRAAVIGKDDAAGINDIRLEAAITAIQDFEDSVAAVDATDKVGVYRNWLGLMRGDLNASFNKAGKQVTRELADDLHFTGTNGEDVILPGRSLLLCRNVGHLMTNSAILDDSGTEVYEGIIDAMVSVAIAMHNFAADIEKKNSRTGSIYIVKPKMHGPEEAAYANQLFNAVEDVLSLDRHSIKIGVMDEERRTSLHLKQCVHEVRHRVVFINTGFLDRTGDEIHTSMHLGPMAPKDEIKQKAWIHTYEDRNVDIGLRCGFMHRAQIGKGMWAIPDKMKDMLESKIAHPQQGANTAWVPSPTAATLHAIHYHRVDVKARQKELLTRALASREDLLQIPLLPSADVLKRKTVQQELDANVQSILGYVVRWIDQGVGCSKVPDINHVGLMEDRATLRISSQHICNWLTHDIVSNDDVRESFLRMAQVVDQQNAGDTLYQPMLANAEENLALEAAMRLVFDGHKQSNGYTEPILHEYRLRLKRELESSS